MNRGNEKQTLFFTDTDYRYFVSLIFRFKNKYHILLYHFVVMPNHFHLLVEPTGENTLAPFLKMVTQYYAIYIRKKHGGAGHVWQNRYKNIPIESESYYLRCARYIELNPVRAGIASHPKEYRWSSYTMLADSKLRRRLDTHPIFSAFTGSNSDITTYENFISLGVDDIKKQQSESFSERKIYATSKKFMQIFN